MKLTSDDAIDARDIVSPAVLRSMIFTNISMSQEPQLLCDFLMELGACSTSITDSNRNTDREVPIFLEPGQHLDSQHQTFNKTSASSSSNRMIWNQCNVVAHFASSFDLELIAELVRTNLDHLSEVKYFVEEVPNRDWVGHVQQSWNPILVEGIVLRFPWHTQEDVDKMLCAESSLKRDNGLIQLQLEGGVAFGTGEHPTTQLCLGWIQRVLRDHNISSLMDYGSGSGVLGLAACAICPSLTAVGVDIDLDAVRIANQNAAINQLSMLNYLPPLEESMDSESKSILMKAFQNDEGQVVLPPSYHGPVHDALVANILAAPLLTLAPTLARLLAPGGQIGLSGILAPQAQMLMDVYVKYFDNVLVERQSGDWVLISGIRNRRDANDI